MKLATVKKILGWSTATVSREREKGVLKAKRRNRQYVYNHECVMNVKLAQDILAGKTDRLLTPERKTYLYGRLSRSAKVRIRRQLRHLRGKANSYCRKHKIGLPEAKAFTDYNAAWDGKKRKGMRALMELAMEGRVGFVFAKSADRFYRGERMFLEMFFDLCGVKIRFFERKLTRDEQHKRDLQVAEHAESFKGYWDQNKEKIQEGKEKTSKEFEDMRPKIKAKLAEYKASGKMEKYGRLKELWERRPMGQGTINRILEKHIREEDFDF